MAENSKIQWTHHTFNPWRGCARVSPGCVHCYAETLSKRNPKTLGTWGVDGTRVVASPSMWQQPVKWNTAAKQAGERHRVFCASLADVGEDRPDLVEPRKRLADLIFRTPNLDWLLLTKRPENMAGFFPADILERCWVGVTAENQEYADARIPVLLRTPAAVRFVSYEPAIGPVDFERGGWSFLRALHPPPGNKCGWPRGIDWLIVGGESGGGARAFDLRWATDAVRQCAENGVACFVKQLGAKPFIEFAPKCDHFISLNDHKGGDMSEWPEGLRVRQFPVPPAGQGEK